MHPEDNHPNPETAHILPVPFPAPDFSPHRLYFLPALSYGCCHIFSRNLWRSFHFDPKIFEQAETIPSFRNPGLSHCPVLSPDIFLPDRPARSQIFFLFLRS